MCYGMRMLPALIVGALTAVYLGLRAGIIAAAVTATALLVAMFLPIPGLTIAIYALIIAWSAAVYFLGGKIAKRAAGPSRLDAVTGLASSWVRKLMKK